MRRRKSPAALTFTFLLATFMAPAPAVLAAGSDGSTESLWNDQSQPGSTSAGVSTSTAPLCTVDTFKQSTLVQSGAWPGLGPFKGDGTQMTDPSQNKVTLQVDRDKITSLELSVADKPKQLVKMQIAADFLLESVGAAPARISDFNSQLAKSRSELTNSSVKNPLSLAAGRYLVYIYPESAHKDFVNFVIRVNSKEMPVEAAPPPIGSARPIVSAPPVESDPPPLLASVPPPVTAPPVSAEPPPTIFMPSTNPDTTHVAVAPPIEGRKPPATQATHSAEPPSMVVAPGTDLKSEFVDVITDWQQIKRLAVKDRDTTGLPKVLGGKALARQTDAIKWLQDNKKHYDMSARNILVDGYSELTKGQKYSVFAQVTELSKYIDDATNDILKDTTSTYKVNYTIEKVDGHWAITDSAMITPTASKTPTNINH